MDGQYFLHQFFDLHYKNMLISIYNILNIYYNCYINHLCINLAFEVKIIYSKSGRVVLMAKTPLKKIIKAKLKANRELTEIEKLREKLKYEIAEELELKEKVDRYGWSSLTAEETGRIGGMMTKRKKELNIPKNEILLDSETTKGN